MAKCEHDKILIRTNDFSELNYIGFSDNQEYENIDMTIELDSRGYIRIIKDGENNCIDTDYNFKINFCPMCGKKFKED